MGIAELVKSPVAAGAFGLAGAGAIGIGGWQYLTSGTEGTVESSVQVVDLFATGGSDCATVLFGMANDSFVYTTDGSANWSTGSFAQPTTTTSSSVLGCMSSFIKNPTGSASNNEHLEIKLAFKNDSTGWFLRSKLSSGGSSVLTHNLFLLEKSSTNQTWGIKTGFEWTDSQLSTLAQNEQINLKIPWATNPKTITLGTTPTEESKFVGVWKTETGEGKKGILEEVSLKKESTSSDVFEKTGETIVTDTINAKKVYDTTSNKWKSVDANASKKNIKDTLNAWYAPFKDVKGSWASANSYCSDTGISSESKIQGLCVQAASSGS